VKTIKTMNKTMNRLKNIFEKDTTLRIISLIFAVAAWFYIMIALNPPTEVTIRNIPIHFNDEYLYERGLVIINSTDLTAQVRVQGSRTVVSALNPQNVLATVDVSHINSVGTHILPVTVSVPFRDVTIVSSNPLTVNIEIDRIVEVEMEIDVETTGRLQSGFIAGDFGISPATVVVSGASSVIGEIDRAVVTVSLTNQTDNFTNEQNIVFVDRYGREVPASLIEFDISTTEVSVAMLQYQSVPIVLNVEADIMNAIANGAYNVSITPETVTILGNPSVVSGVDEILTHLVHFDSLNGLLVSRATLQLPSGIELYDGSTGVVVTLSPVAPPEENGENTNVDEEYEEDD